MNITEITYSEGKTIQEESYSPRSFHLSAKAEVKDENIQEAFEELKKEVKEALRKEVIKWTDPSKAVRERVKELNSPF